MNSSISNKEKTNPDARGDGLHLSDNAKINSFDTKTISLDFPSSAGHFASGEPNENPICYSTSSSTFIVSSSLPSDIPTESKELCTVPRNIPTNILASNEESIGQHHWISLSIFIGILFVLIMITVIFLHWLADFLLKRKFNVWMFSREKTSTRISSRVLSCQSLLPCLAETTALYSSSFEQQLFLHYISIIVYHSLWQNVPYS